MFTSGGRKTQTDVCTTECPLKFHIFICFYTRSESRVDVVRYFRQDIWFKKRAAHSGILKYGNVCKSVRKKMF